MQPVHRCWQLQHQGGLHSCHASPSFYTALAAACAGGCHEQGQHRHRRCLVSSSCWAAAEGHEWCQRHWHPSCQPAVSCLVVLCRASSLHPQLHLQLPHPELTRAFESISPLEDLTAGQLCLNSPLLPIMSPTFILKIASAMLICSSFTYRFACPQHICALLLAWLLVKQASKSSVIGNVSHR